MKFVFDLDGTLCFDRHRIDSGLKELLERAETTYGHEVIFATARSYRDCLALLGDQLAKRPVVGLNGGLAYDRGKLIFRRHLDIKAYHEVLSWCYSYNLPFFVDDDFNYAAENKHRMPFIESVDPLGLAEELPVSDLANPIKIVISMANHEDLVETLIHDFSLLKAFNIVYHDDEKCLYLNPSRTNKATTLEELYGTEFVAFGNDRNDIEVFNLSLYSVQVGSFKPLAEYAEEQVAAEVPAISAKIEELFEKFA